MTDTKMVSIVLYVTNTSDVQIKKSTDNISTCGECSEAAALASGCRPWVRAASSPSSLVSQYIAHDLDSE